MDNMTQTPDPNNTSTQKTVRLKPLVKQPVVGDNTTESQSVKKVSTNSGAFPRVGTQTGRISSLATNTARVVRINSALKSSTAPAAPGASPAAAPQNVLNSLNLKPKVAAASVVENTPAAENTQTSALPKAPAPVRPSISIPAAAAPAPAAPAPAAPAPAPASAAPASQDTQTAAVTKPAAAKPAINIGTPPAAAAQESDDATVKLKRPQRPTASHTNSVVPTISAAPKITVPGTAEAPATVKPSQAPTVKFNLNNPAAPAAAPTAQTQAAPEAPEAPEAPAAPATPAAPAAPKLGLKKEEPAAPQPAPAPAQAAAAKEDAPKDDAPKKKKKKVPAAAASANVKKEAAAPANAYDCPGFHFSFGFLTVIALIAATTLCCLQYINTYEPQLFGKYIQVPFMEQVGK